MLLLYSLALFAGAFLLFAIQPLFARLALPLEAIRHVHHAGNSSGIVDGAAAVLLGSERAVKRSGLTPRARVVAYAVTSTDPTTMLTGPVPATRKALERAGWKAADVDLFELNEAFAAQACAVNKELGIDAAKVNVNGGAIAIGHPIGASGARILVTLLHEMQRREAKKGIAALCIGGGMGVSLAVERV